LVDSTREAHSTKFQGDAVITVKRTPFELARLQQIRDLSNSAMTMDCMEAVALERRIAALERGLPHPTRDRIRTGSMAAKSSSRRVDVSALQIHRTGRRLSCL
jgi:hypothetical protein